MHFQLLLTAGNTQCLNLGTAHILQTQLRAMLWMSLTRSPSSSTSTRTLCWSSARRRHSGCSSESLSIRQGSLEVKNLCSRQQAEPPDPAWNAADEVSYFCSEYLAKLFVTEPLQNAKQSLGQAASSIYCRQNIISSYSATRENRCVDLGSLTFRSKISDRRLASS